MLSTATPGATPRASDWPETMSDPNATQATEARLNCLKDEDMGTPDNSVKIKLVQHCAETRHCRRARRERVLEDPTDVFVFGGRGRARGTVLGDGELTGMAEGLAVEREGDVGV